MSEQDVILDQFEIRDLEDDFNYRVAVESSPTLGNFGKPGIRIRYTVPGTSTAAVFEPYMAEKWHYAAKKEGVTAWLVKDRSWLHYDNAWLKNYLVIDGDKLKVRVEVKVKSRENPEIREYDLPFSF